mmetsp:Transcript_1914/g.6114  ORF Transcript_1914/g.6114 Transcript_1914/m.6114 type:complete len:157 (+) Transcript_1914:72-542(+)
MMITFTSTSLSSKSALAQRGAPRTTTRAASKPCCCSTATATTVEKRKKKMMKTMTTTRGRRGKGMLKSSSSEESSKVAIEDDDDDEDYSNCSSAIDELESRVWQLEFVVRGKYADEKYDERGTRGGKQRERRFGETHGASVSRRSRTRTGVEIVLR